MFDELNKYTSKITGNYQLTTSGNTVYDDHWGITDTYNGYIYFGTHSSDQADPTKKNLLNLYDGWTSSEVSSRYSIPGATSDTSTSNAPLVLDMNNIPDSSDINVDDVW